ncbi:Elongation of very long chain fatty acids protein 4 [Papilio xuthus]|uniref:Elongation of very long chain fatty acids protein n=1 Tax=Papilio xuthus TaxID=66420 RepID=A0A194Q3Y4_PAPXU|nr:Elongation of very long chain fatty acids protein 4 [Papilio xuthus]
MDLIYKPFIENTKESIEDYSFETWTLQETVVYLVFVIGAYLALVLKILPDYMKKRRPYTLKGLLICYNAFQVFYSAYLVILYTSYIIKHGIICTSCPRGELLREVTRDIFPYFLAKQIDLLDTIFFVLRKKDNQVTFLHVYHHCIMVTWATLYYLHKPSDHFVGVGLMNSFVHVIMYAYYGLSAMGPRFAKFVWWKKHLTKVQLIQFILVISNLHYQQKLTPCPIPAAFHYFCVLSIGSFFILFMKFYLKSYIKRSIPKNWTALRTIGAAAVVIAIYLLVVLKLIPGIMMKRKPYQMKPLLLFYNAFQVYYSGYMVYIYADYVWNFGIFPFRCPQNNPDIIGTAVNNIYPYFVAKHLDLLDTVFFRLRKKDNQVTFLHLYHHSIMVLWGWLYYMFLPTDHFVITGLLNSFVHVVMYSYYGITCLGPRFAKYVWWKKHLTKIQLVQFVLAVTNLYYQQKWTPCPLPVAFHYFALGTLLSFFILFLNFYFKSYKLRKDLENNQRDVDNKAKMGNMNGIKSGCIKSN